MNIYLRKIISLSQDSTKYLEWYISIINRALSRASSRKLAEQLLDHVEAHHILPKCMCDDESYKTDKENIAFLSIREHFICHVLLDKIFSHPYKLKMAVSYFTSRGKHLTSKQYDRARRAYLECDQSFKANIGPKNGMYGRQHSASSIQRMKDAPRASKGKTYEQIYGLEKSSELRDKRSKAGKLKDNAGRKNSRFDKTIYHLYNSNTEESFIGYRFDFMKMYPAVTAEGMTCMIQGKYSQTKGWRIQSTTPSL